VPGKAEKGAVCVLEKGRKEKNRIKNHSKIVEPLRGFIAAYQGFPSGP
jgi:hypothetical protein